MVVAAMRKATLPRPTQPVGVLIQGVTLWSEYDSAAATHHIACDLCGFSVNAGPYANDTRIGQHRNGRDCYRRQRDIAIEQVRQQQHTDALLMLAQGKTCAASAVCCSHLYCTVSPVLRCSLRLASGLALGYISIPDPRQL